MVIALLCSFYTIRIAFLITSQKIEMKRLMSLNFSVQHNYVDKS